MRARSSKAPVIIKLFIDVFRTINFGRSDTISVAPGKKFLRGKWQPFATLKLRWEPFPLALSNVLDD